METFMETSQGKRKHQQQNDDNNVRGSSVTPEDHLKRKRMSEKVPIHDLETEDDCFPLTVEDSSGCDGKGSRFIRHFQVDLLSHCIFCLRKTSTKCDVTSAPILEGPTIQVVPRDTLLCSKPSTYLPTFNRCFSYLERTKFGNEDEKFLDDMLGPISLKDGSTTNFLDLPRMCEFCSGNIKTVHRLCHDLQLQLKILEKINEAKYNGSHWQYPSRAEQFKSILKKSSLDSGLVAATINFLNALEKGKDSVLHSVDRDPLHVEEPEKNLILISDSAPSSLVMPSSSCISSPSTQFQLEAQNEMKSKVGGPSVTNSSQAPSTSNEHGEDFVDENDEDECNKSDMNDPDYIKSEDESGDSNADDDESWSGGTVNQDGPGQPQQEPSSTAETKIVLVLTGKRSNNATKFSNSSKIQTVVKSQASKAAENVQENAAKQNLLTVDVLPRNSNFLCTIEGCGVLYKKWGFLRDHHVDKHNVTTYPQSLYKCKDCDKSFSYRDNLVSHRRTAHGKLPKSQVRQCDLCKINVPLKGMYEHVREHIGEEYVIKCPNPQCLYAFSNMSSLTLHLRTGSKMRQCKKFVGNLEEFVKASNVCEVCGYLARNVYSLYGHLHSVHENPTKSFNCPIENCPQRFTIKQSVMLHIPQHDMRRKFETQFCCECSKSMKLDKMVAHLRDIHQTQEVVKCNRCPFLFSSREQLVEHLFEHRHGDLACDICGDQVKFHRHVRLREHYLNEHKIGKQYICEQCGYKTWKKDQVTRHMKEMHGNGTSGGSTTTNNNSKQKPELKCDVCEGDDKVYKSENSLRYHKIKEHGAEPFGCKFCSETFITRHQQYKHEREQHKGVAPREYRCDVEYCGRDFKSKKTLQKHISATHLGQKTCVCDLCGKAFAYDSSLRTHKDTVHLGLRPFVCDTCGEGFSCGTALRNHIMIHTGERPFACEICDQRFRHRVSLRTHLEAHRKKGAAFKPNGPMKQTRKRVSRKKNNEQLIN